jgi:hypothetical protein
MMEMDFHIAKAAVTQPGNRLHERAFIFVLGVEKRVLWSLTPAIRKPFRQYRVLPDPALDPLLLYVPCNMVPLGLKMIRHANEGVAGLLNPCGSSGSKIQDG